jgi:thiamine-phosphate pyrophosphorylase
LLPHDEVAGLNIPFQKIYPITDCKLSGLSIVEQVTQFIEGGAALIQIRDKNASSAEMFKDISAAVKIAHEAKVVILVNDRVDIALTTGADGVHLGQRDMPINAARHILGHKAIIGVSTHNEGQVREALAEAHANYVAFGPIFETNTKIDHDPLVGLESLRHIRELIGDRLPLVAIGGINAGNLASVLRAGAHSAAIISQFYLPGTNISSQFKSLLEAAESINNVMIS